MPSTAAGEYYSLFSDPSSGTTVEVAIFLLIWEFTILSALCGMMVYLTYFRNKIPIATLGNLQMACLLSICTTLALLSQFIDTSPPFLCWLSQWGSILLNLFLILLALERFKTFFVLSGHFSGSTVRLAQRAFIICYVICAASQYIILFRLGTRDYPAWVDNVDCSNASGTLSVCSLASRCWLIQA